jgi:hypothetical protein
VVRDDRDYPLATAREVGLVNGCDRDQPAFGAEYQSHAEQPVEDGVNGEPQFASEAVYPLFVVAGSGPGLKPARESGRLQGTTVQCGESKQCQVDQLCEPESRTVPTFEQPTSSAGNTPHGCSLPQSASVDQTQFWWG